MQGVFDEGTFYPQIPTETKYYSPFQYFINCILNNEKPFVSGEEGRADLELVLAGYKSMKERGFVTLPL
jgi:predicted dehydrogenase